MHTLNKIIVLSCFVIFSIHTQAQTALDNWYCDNFGTFEPFEYNENTSAFTFNLSENCDPNNSGGFTYYDLLSGNTTPQTGSDYSHIVENITADMPLHYSFRENPTSGFGLRSVAWAGVELNHDESKGRVLLVMDAPLLTSISEDIAEYKEILIRDGWKVSILTVEEDATIQSVKADIQEIYDVTGDLVSFFIMGDVPVPYSGSSIGPDGHGETRGAWMSDSYYADLDGTWTDATANNTSANFERHHNVPGDGKFDHNTMPSDAELEFGRIHFENLPVFSETREELYTRYLQKDIRYRKGLAQANNDYFLHHNNAAFPSSMHRALYLLHGTAPADKKFTQTDNPVVMETLPFDSYNYTSINGFGAGGGFQINGRINGNDFKNDSLEANFVTLSASFIGNWGFNNNLLNVACASKSTTIMANWGLLVLPMHYLYSGKTYGYCLKRGLNQTNEGGYWTGFNGYSSRTVSHNIVGDPTLKFFVHTPLDAITLEPQPTSVNLIATEGTNNPETIGYNVYRATTIDGDFEKLNTEPLPSPTYTDDFPLEGNNVYMIRSLRLDSSMVASYYTYSNGVIDSLFFAYPDLDEDGFSILEDCDDNNPNVNPDQTEIPYNSIDDDCNALTLDDDLDEDGFGIDTDCDDENANINPDAEDIVNNGIDEDCDGEDMLSATLDLAGFSLSVYPNPTSRFVNVEAATNHDFQINIFDLFGRKIKIDTTTDLIDLGQLTSGVYLMEFFDPNTNIQTVQKIILEK